MLRTLTQSNIMPLIVILKIIRYGILYTYTFYTCLCLHSYSFDALYKSVHVSIAVFILQLRTTYIVHVPHGANVWRGKILMILMKQNFIVKIFPINILHFNKIIYLPLLVIFMAHTRVYWSLITCLPARSVKVTYFYSSKSLTTPFIKICTVKHLRHTGCFSFLETLMLQYTLKCSSHTYYILCMHLSIYNYVVVKCICCSYNCTCTMSIFTEILNFHGEGTVTISDQANKEYLIVNDDDQVVGSQDANSKPYIAYS